MEARHLMKLALLLCAVAFPALAAAARPAKSGSSFVVRGRVFCDTCRAGFETPATTYLSGAKVQVVCRERTTGEVKYTAEGVTDATGTYNIMVANEHESQICESVLLSSSEAGCSQLVPGRDRARVVLTHNNGMPSSVRLANSLGFQKDSALSGCAEIMKMYQLDTEDVY